MQEEPTQTQPRKRGMPSRTGPAIMHVLADGKRRSISQLANATGAAASGVLAAVKQLVAGGVLREIPSNTTARNVPRALYTLAEQPRTAPHNARRKPNGKASL